MHDVLIIGGGVIGLSLAWELVKRGKSVQLIDQGQPGQEASWAGAGILPPAALRPGDHPLDQLRGLAYELHPRWAADLQEFTGIDTGYRRCGGLYLSQSPGESAALAAWADTLRDEGIEVEKLSAADLSELEPSLRRTPSTEYSVLSTQYLLPEEGQLRNPRHLKALVAACEKSGVTISPHIPASEFVVSKGELTELRTTAGALPARQFCFTAGAWTGHLLQRLGIGAGILPIRGQMVLFRCQRPPITRIVNLGSRYLVPRDDGYVLAGSTEEEVGFDKRTTEEAIADLTQFARDLAPALREATIERTWAGLRPGSFDGLPYLGPLPGLKNAFIAAGHFRTGLFLSPATAYVMSQLIRGEQPQLDLAPFRVGR
ncbi:MAG TPA: glycine oxidase ThiO [Pirellulaceae bacterium]|nr:glycine oxidase ThiO [Pirellulaceae bacterium]